MWYLLLVGVIIAFVFLHVLVLPRCFLHISNDGEFGDRGIKNITEANGHTILYSPRNEYRKFLKYYAVSKRDGELVLVCDFNKKVSIADFDISLVDGTGKVFKVLNVKQRVKNGESEKIYLPSQTAYVSISLNNVNGIDFLKRKSNGFPVSKIALFLLSISVVEYFTFFAIKAVVANLNGGIFTQSFVESQTVNLLMSVIALIIIIINDLITVFVVTANNRKKGGEKR